MTLQMSSDLVVISLKNKVALLACGPKAEQVAIVASLLLNRS